MKNVSAATSSNNMSSSYHSRVEGIVLCSVFLLEAVLISVGNLLTFVVFASKKTLRKKSHLLVINMAFADAILGAVAMPLYVFLWIGPTYWLWNYKKKLSLDISHISWSSVDATFTQSSLISAAAIAFERFYAIYWPLKHRTMSFKAYYIIIFIIWTLAFLLSAAFNIALFLISSKAASFCWMSFSLPSLFIVCACSIGIWKKFQLRNISSQQQNRAFLNKRLTLTLLLVSTISVLSWLPLLITNCLIYILKINIPKVDLFYYIITLLNFSNSLVNPVVYSLRIPEFRQALGFCIRRGRKLINRDERNKGRDNREFALMPAIRPSTQANDQNRLQKDFELEPIVTKL